jgi:HK97 gp10 family phage protein
VIKSTVTGIPDLKAALANVSAQLKRRILRNALAAGARVVRDDARRRAPVIAASALPVRQGLRTPGTVKQAIVVRTSKQARREGNVGVFVNVRPAKAGNRGAKNRNDPFYWRFVEFGTRFFRPGVGVQFLQRAADRLPQALQVFIAKVGPQIDKLNNPGGKGRP